MLDAGGGGILYIDTQELMPSCAFETFEKLSQGLEISPPKKALKAKFEYKFWNPLSLLLPYYLYLSSKDFAKIPAIVLHVEENIIKNCQNSYVDIKSYILDPCDLHYENLAINVLKKNAHFILENEEILKALKNYFKQFVLILEEKVQLRQKYAINEEVILSYLKENHTTAKKLKDILELELTHIKQVRPDIIASWKYYAEFEKIWEKLELSRS
ncbi:DUF2972 domain-containing protein [Campylobacter upsaliensis]|nr:DUF2972 domain-containing protein [Campylobacter upsaliensis]